MDCLLADAALEGWSCSAADISAIMEADADRFLVTEAIGECSSRSQTGINFHYIFKIQDILFDIYNTKYVSVRDRPICVYLCLIIYKDLNQYPCCKGISLGLSGNRGKRGQMNLA